MLFGRCQLFFFMPLERRGSLLFRVNDSMEHSPKAKKTKNDKKSLNGNLIKIKIRKG
jgi:hypothetical protein